MKRLDAPRGVVTLIRFQSYVGRDIRVVSALIPWRTRTQELHDHTRSVI